MGDEEREALADMLVRCGIERGVLGRIDADNVARILLPVVDAIARRRAAEELRAAAANYVTRQEDRDLLRARADDLDSQ